MLEELSSWEEGGEIGEQKGHEAYFPDTHRRGCDLCTLGWNRIFGHRYLACFNPVAFSGSGFGSIWCIYEDGGLR